MFTVDNVIKSFHIFQEKIKNNKEYLSELDTSIGDGDHGNNMDRGMKAVLERIEVGNPQSVNEVFKLVALTLISKVGGASGPLYGTAVMEMAKASVKSDNTLEILEAGYEGIKKRGNSQAGEKTMLDVWHPAIESVRLGTLSFSNLNNFSEDTKQLIATKGRASYLGERSLGHIDPGAKSSQYLFESFIEAGVFNE